MNITKKYIKKPCLLPDAKPGSATWQFTDKQTGGMTEVVKEAVEANYVHGDPFLIFNDMSGLLVSMASGISRDGRPRTIEGFATMHLTVTGPFDLEKGWDPEKNRRELALRLLNGCSVSLANCPLEDATPGKRAFTLTAVESGEDDGVVTIGSAVGINGRQTPAKVKGEGVRVSWALVGTDRHGDVADAKVASTVTRIDLAADAIEGLTDADAGKEIEFTVRGNFATARVRAVVKAAAIPPAPTARIDEISSLSAMSDNVYGGGETHIVGGNLFASPNHRLTAKQMRDGEVVRTGEIDPAKLREPPVGPGETLQFSMSDILPDLSDDDAGDTVEFTLVTFGGVEGSAPQTLVHTCNVVENPL